ncbi:aminotransferase class III-fold pyridoxal phosphate-dependent enzyme [bacterium]|nr:aminotransferase class III-fold pyridoxal phosphate-dependent enzyme [bacterium]
MSESKSFQRLSTVWARPWQLLVDQGEGPYLYTKEGRRYLDFTSGIGVTNTGHAHPVVVKAIQEQAARLLHGQINIVYHEPLLELAESLVDVLPASLDAYFFTNSGAEAVESAVKLAKVASGKSNVIVFKGSFHGRTHGAMALTASKTVYRSGYQPLMPGVFIAPFPYTYRYGWDEKTTVDFCIRELEDLLKMQTSPEETACVLIEPVLGEGGYVIPPRSFVGKLSSLCDDNGLLLLADEVQTGFGRTGKWFAVEHSDVVPDILIMAKGMASGMPLSGIAAPSELMQKWQPGTHGGTYAGNAVSCAAATATIQVIQDEDLVANSAAMGETLLFGLRQLQQVHPEMADVRGLGLMLGVEFETDTGAPWGERAKAVAHAAYERGLLLLTCGTHEQVIRWIPPLIITDKEVEESLSIFAEALSACS